MHDRVRRTPEHRLVARRQVLAVVRTTFLLGLAFLCMQAGLYLLQQYRPLFGTQLLVRNLVLSAVVLLPLLYLLAALPLLRYLRRASNAEDSRTGLLHTIAAGIMVYAPDGTAIEVNERACEILGQTMKQLLGQRSSEPSWHTIHEDGTSFPVEQHPVRVTLRTGKAQHAVSMGVFHPATDDYRWILISTEPVHSATGVLRCVVATFINITERVEAKQQLHTSEERYRLLAETSHDAIYLLDRQGLITYCSPATEGITGYAISELVGTRLLAHVMPKYRQQAEAALRCGMLRERSGLLELSFRRKNGEMICAEVSIAPLVDDGGVMGLQAVIRDITDRRRVEEQIRFQAFHDTLTGLPNRMLLEDRMLLAQANARREGHRMALMFLDLDRFKSVNDSLGHLIGDRMLQEVAHRLTNRLREGDTIARISGDEFIILLPKITNEADAFCVADKVLTHFSDPFIIEGNHINVTLSIGIAIYPEDGADTLQLMRNADVALYHAKRQGRNCFQYFSSVPDDLTGLPVMTAREA